MMLKTDEKPHTKGRNKNDFSYIGNYKKETKAKKYTKCVEKYTKNERYIFGCVNRPHKPLAKLAFVEGLFFLSSLDKQSIFPIFGCIFCGFAQRKRKVQMKR